MDSEHKASDVSCAPLRRARKLMSVEHKVKLLDCSACGKGAVSFGRNFGGSESTI